MSLYVSDFLDGRIDDIMQDLRNTDSEYALSLEKSRHLHNDVEPILNSKKELLITEGDCLKFRELLEQEFTMTAIMQQEIYKKGYLDCVKVLKMIGVLQ